MSERRDGMLSVPEPAAGEARGEAERCASNANLRFLSAELCQLLS